MMDVFTSDNKTLQWHWQRIAPTAPQLSTYDYARASLIRNGVIDDNVCNYAVSSLLAAFTAWDGTRFNRTNLGLSLGLKNRSSFGLRFPMENEMFKNG